MNRAELIEDINTELKNLDLPSFRKRVTKTGRNVEWLLKNVSTRNSVPDTLIHKLKKLINK